MAARKVTVVEVRPASPDERRLVEFFDELEKTSLKNLEDAARQIIGLVTALLTLTTGLLGLGREPLAALLGNMWVLGVGAVTVLALFLALVAALAVVTPAAYRFRSASFHDRRVAYDQMLERKSRGLRAAVVFFGIAMAGLVAQIGLILWSWLT